MDSTQALPRSQSRSQTHSTLSIKASTSKLPIKRKILDSSSSTPFPNPAPNPNFLSPKLVSTPISLLGDDDCTTPNAAVDGFDCDPKPSPFKFHRIWTEPDEIRLLQCLLDCSSQGLSFPRDLSVFYARFSNTMSQPYTKSQLSEKLRRLRKKFRVIASRLARGLDESVLSPHNRALFELSKKLWSSEFSASSPFGNSLQNYNSGSSNSNSSRSKIDANLVVVEVNFSPTLPICCNTTQSHNLKELDNGSRENDGVVDHDNIDNGADGGEKMKEVNIDYVFVGHEEEGLCVAGPKLNRSRLGGVAATTVLNVFDECLKEVRMALVRKGIAFPECSRVSSGPKSKKEGKAVDFERRGQELKLAELELLARRMRLVLEDSLCGR